MRRCRPVLNQRSYNFLFPTPNRHRNISYDGTRIQYQSILAQKLPATGSLARKPILPALVDPYILLAPELAHLQGCLTTLLGSAHPGLQEIAKYYFIHPSQQIRPLLVLLMARATNGLGENWSTKAWQAECEFKATEKARELNEPLTRPDTLHYWNPNMPDHSETFNSVFTLRSTPIQPSSSPPLPSSDSFSATSLKYHDGILPTQTRLAQIIEMIHVASLLHEDIMERTPVSQGILSSFFPTSISNKLAILGGDFLLGRASAALARLGEAEVVELVSSVISNIVEGEALVNLQSPSDGNLLGVADTPEAIHKLLSDAWKKYFRKVTLRTSGLLAKSARASVVLGGCTEGEVWKSVAYDYGMNFGIAFQMIDDAIQFESADDATFIKASKSGVIPAPLLYAIEDYPPLIQMIQRNFAKDGDLSMVNHYMLTSNATQRTRSLAREYGDKALECLETLPPSEARESLKVLIIRILERT